MCVTERRHSKKFASHSIFISDQVAEPKANLAIAQSLGRALQARGLTPTLHHAEPIKGENRELLDKELGIYNFPQLYVLRTAQYPALLFEAGINLNPDEEAKLNDAAHRGRIVSALLEAVATACRDASPPARGQ